MSISFGDRFSNFLLSLSVVLCKLYKIVLPIYIYICFNITVVFGCSFPDDSPTDDRCRRRSRLLSEGEVVLLESVAHHGKRLPNGRFLTMHKRRRKKLTTRSLSNENAPALLDDIHHGQVQVRMLIEY